MFAIFSRTAMLAHLLFSSGRKVSIRRHTQPSGEVGWACRTICSFLTSRNALIRISDILSIGHWRNLDLLGDGRDVTPDV